MILDWSIQNEETPVPEIDNALASAQVAIGVTPISFCFTPAQRRPLISLTFHGVPMAIHAGDAPTDRMCLRRA